jgi:heat-inducible transcriptional repressor
MNQALTARQTQILKSLIDEYIETAEPVGSLALEKKYNLGISPATVRNEMVNLTKAGYLKQPHTSAGRIPTSVAMKFYINQLMEEKQMSLADEVKVKEDVWDSRKNFDHFMDEMTHSLSDMAKNPAIAATSDGKVWKAGFPSVMENPEFFDDRSACIGIYSLLDEAERLQELLLQRLTGASPIEVIFGDDLGWPDVRPISVVATHFKAGNRVGAIGVIGPTRQHYQSLIPTIRYFNSLLEDIFK